MTAVQTGNTLAQTGLVHNIRAVAHVKAAATCAEHQLN